MLHWILKIFFGRNRYQDSIVPCNILIGEIRNKLINRHECINVLQPLARTRFVVFDTETTGFNPHNNDKIIALGAVVVENGKLDRNKNFNRLINPGRNIPDKISELTGITNEMVAYEDNFFEVLNDFLDFIGDSILVAHNADFDVQFINSRLKVCQTKLNCPVIDTLKISYSLHPRLKCHTLDKLLYLHKISSVNRHTAHGDAILTGILFEKFLVKLRELHISTVLDLYNHLHWQFYR